jgi:hypothetical protein
MHTVKRESGYEHRPRDMERRRHDWSFLEFYLVADVPSA